MAPDPVRPAAPSGGPSLGGLRGPAKVAASGWAGLRLREVWLYLADDRVLASPDGVLYVMWGGQAGCAGDGRGGLEMLAWVGVCDAAHHCRRKSG